MFLALLVACQTAPPPVAAEPPPGQAVLISADTATGLVGGWRAGASDIDDGLAVLMALRDPRLQVGGVAVTFGNNDMQPEVLVLEKLLRELAGDADTPIWRGAAVALSAPDQVSWFDGAPLLAGCENEAVAAMADALRAGPRAIAALGPLTDAACLAQNHPDAAANITDLVVIGGRAPGQVLGIGEKQGLSDFNLSMDERALQILLEETEIPLTFMAFSLTSSALVTREAFGELAERESEVARWVHAAGQPWIDQWARIFQEDGFHPWDQNAIAWLAEPEMFQCDAVGWELVDCAPDEEGASACAGHGPDQSSSLDKEGYQLWLGAGDGRPVRACSAYADDAAKGRFLEAVLDGIR